MAAKAVLKYPGSKWSLADRIVALLPGHEVYLEPFFGSGAVLFCKPRCRLETVNDLDHRVVNLFRVLRERPNALARAIALTPWSAEEHRQADSVPLTALSTGDAVEDARRFLVVAWQSHGADSKWRNGWKRASRDGLTHPVPVWLDLPDRLLLAAERLRGVQIECRPALEAIARHQHPDCLIYADPPYPLSRRYRPYYRHEMTDADHVALLDALDAHPGPVVLSGYRCPLYDERLAGWQRLDMPTTAEGGRARVESVWLNARAARPTLFDLASVEEAAGDD